MKLGATTFVVAVQLFLDTVPLFALRGLQTATVSAAAGNDVIRCYCNDAACVVTGYMCKSTVGACFSTLSLGGANTARIRYACADRLPSADRRLCVTAVESAKSTGDIDVVYRKRPHSEPETEITADTTCCATDMCNYYYYRTRGVAAAAQTGNTSNDSLNVSRQLQSSVDVLVLVSLLCATVLLTLVVLSTLRHILFTNRCRRPCHVKCQRLPTSKPVRPTAAAAVAALDAEGQFNAYIDGRADCQCLDVVPSLSRARRCCCYCCTRAEVDSLVASSRCRQQLDVRLLGDVTSMLQRQSDDEEKTRAAGENAAVHMAPTNTSQCSPL